MVGANELTFQVSTYAALLLQLIDSITEYRIPHERRHSSAVAAYSLGLTRISGLSFDARKIQLLWYAALLHDVGKLCLPSAIWNYPRKLTTAEYSLVKTHARLGFEMLNALEISNDVKFAVLHHHERWDGSGYPDELKGMEIPLFAQIIAAADVFDALTHRRTYREAFSAQEARKIMQEEPLKFNPLIIEGLEALDNDSDLIATILPTTDSTFSFHVTG